MCAVRMQLQCGNCDSASSHQQSHTDSFPTAAQHRSNYTTTITTLTKAAYEMNDMLYLVLFHSFVSLPGGGGGYKSS